MKNISSNFKKLLRRTDLTGLSVFGKGQTFDWEFILSVFILIMIIVVSFSVHVFLGVRAADIFKDDYKAPARDSRINNSQMDEVISEFAARKAKLESLKVQKTFFVDPSL